MGSTKNSDSMILKSFKPYIKPTPETAVKYEAIQKKVFELAELIVEICPSSREQSISLTNLQSVKMFANAAIAIYSPSAE
jgi:hypothetical protein